MIAVSILYPSTADSHFDMDYYTTKHTPMFADALGEACKGWGVFAPAVKYHAVAWAMIESQDAFNAAMASKGAEIMGDIPNYTDAAPELIIGDVVV